MVIGIFDLFLLLATLGRFSLQKVRVFHLQLGPTGYLGPKTSKTGKETQIRGGLGVPQIHSFSGLNLWSKLSKTDILAYVAFYMHVMRNLMAVSFHKLLTRKIFITLPKICFFRDYASNWQIVAHCCSNAALHSLFSYIEQLKNNRVSILGKMAKETTFYQGYENFPHKISMG